MQQGEVILLIGSLIHLMLTVMCFSVSKNAFKHMKDYTFILYFFMCLPLINVIVALLMLDTSATIYKRHYEEKVDMVEALRDENITLRQNLDNITKSKLRRVRVGDIFVFPKGCGFKPELENCKAKILRIDEKGVTSIVISKKILDKDGEETTWSSSWENIKQVIFLSQESFKPFEFVE